MTRDASLKSLQELTLADEPLIRLCEIGLSKICPAVTNLSLKFDIKEDVSREKICCVGLPQLRDLCIQSLSRSYPATVKKPCETIAGIHDSFKNLTSLIFKELRSWGYECRETHFFC